MCSLKALFKNACILPLPLTTYYYLCSTKPLTPQLSQWINHNKNDILDAYIFPIGPYFLTFFVLYTFCKQNYNGQFVVILAYCAPETSWRRLQRTIWYNVCLKSLSPKYYVMNISRLCSYTQPKYVQNFYLSPLAVLRCTSLFFLPCSFHS